MVIVDSQSRLGSHQARVLSAGGEEEEEVGAPEWFPPAKSTLKQTLIHNIISVLLGSHPSEVSPAACNGGDGSL